MAGSRAFHPSHHPLTGWCRCTTPSPGTCTRPPRATGTGSRPMSPSSRAPVWSPPATSPPATWATLGPPRAVGRRVRRVGYPRRLRLRVGGAASRAGGGGAHEGEVIKPIVLHTAIPGGFTTDDFAIELMVSLGHTHRMNPRVVARVAAMVGRPSLLSRLCQRGRRCWWPGRGTDHPAVAGRARPTPWRRRRAAAPGRRWWSSTTGWARTSMRQIGQSFLNSPLPVVVYCRLRAPGQPRRERSSPRRRMWRPWRGNRRRRDPGRPGRRRGHRQDDQRRRLICHRHRRKARPRCRVRRKDGAPGDLDHQHRGAGAGGGRPGGRKPDRPAGAARRTGGRGERRRCGARHRRCRARGARDRFFRGLLAWLADPTPAFLFLAIGTLAIFYQLSTPGTGLGGAVGVVFGAGAVLVVVSRSTWPGRRCCCSASGCWSPSSSSRDRGPRSRGEGIALVIGRIFLFEGSLGVSLLVVGAGAAVLAVACDRRRPSGPTGPGATGGERRPVIPGADVDDRSARGNGGGPTSRERGGRRRAGRPGTWEQRPGWRGGRTEHRR